eukprot:6466460-Amphidinium_carterae.1
MGFEDVLTTCNYLLVLCNAAGVDFAVLETGIPKALITVKQLLVQTQHWRDAERRGRQKAAAVAQYQPEVREALRQLAAAELDMKQLPDIAARCTVWGEALPR